MEVEKAEKMAKIDTDKFEQMVSARGQETLLAMASGPQDHQVKMFQSLGLSSTLITIIQYYSAAVAVSMYGLPRAINSLATFTLLISDLIFCM